MQRLFLASLATVLLLGCGTKLPTSDATYFLVRHAEKSAEKPDPALTGKGQKRAKDLAARLAKTPLSKIYTTDYRRTRDTAGPIAATKGLEVILYDPRDLEAFSRRLLSETGHILVVGHSNTTPSLSGLLGGMTGEPIVEATEYNRLYIVTRNDKDIESRIERYGE